MISYLNDKYPKSDGNGNTSNTISHLLAGSKNLSTLPEINLKLIKACNSGKESITEIAELIKLDPALSLKVMDMYYTGYPGRPKKLINLESALNLIGIDMIRIMVSCSSTASIFEGVTVGTPFDLKLFWRHSLKCAYIAEIISKEIPNQSSDDAFMAGLFHDIGKLILLSSLPNIYGKLLSDKTDETNLLAKEKKTIGTDHCYIGYRLIDRWQYYPFVSDAILYHHYAIEKIAAAFPAVKILFLANLLAGQEIHGQGDIFNTAKTLFGFNQDKVEEYILYAETKLHDAVSAFEMDDIASDQIQTVNTIRNNARFYLANEVRDTSLIAYTMQNILTAKDKLSILQIIRQGLQILFGKSDITFFIYDSADNTLVGHSSKDDEYSGLIDGLRIPALSDNSIPVLCLKNNSPVDSFSYQKRSEITITDSQLIHFHGKEGILCLPMNNKNEKAGVMVIGVDRAEYSFLSKQINLLNAFARQCAIALLSKNSKEDGIKESAPSQAGAGAIVSRKIIHEINNPLSVIKNYLKVLGMKLSDHDIAHDEIRIINDEINRIVKMLRKFSASPDKETRIIKEPINVNILLQDIVKLTRGSLVEGEGIKILLDNDPSLPDIITERDNLKQVFINLIKNAIEAMPGGGNIVIKTICFSPEKEGECINEAETQNKKVRIIISDDGPGIPDDIREKVFNEFVTSKNGHEGLGLSIVKGIINRLNGTIICESLKGSGTVFIIDLPLRTAS